MRVLDIEISPDLLASWVGWLAPDRQLFFVTADQAKQWGLPLDPTEPDQNLRDTYRRFWVDKGLKSVWLDEAAFFGLPRETRAELVRAQVTHERSAVPTVRAWRDELGPAIAQQADGHRFVWWKSVLRDSAAVVLSRLLSQQYGPSRHRAVPAEVWNAAAPLLPRVRELAGTFANGSGPNCFGTVMAAAGVEGAAEQWMQREPFEQWLQEHTTRGGDDAVPGTVLVWRDSEHAVQHAAVTLGPGWTFHKPNQTWSGPRKVRTTQEVIKSNRASGRYLHRYTIHR
ncbi:hypothetical protein Kfla_5596 [Kribbella flavida DSM 17836]|uniref:Uncharacterized protein n=1 Tax=Kribbella flavida (strain DSM 17836 / JCM 10339 / NBRC 14399) TaxID=479435 RepID=D2PNB8_KRIFD|nr:hypothetical protein [Kribbella flavida]ADB34602.1 hypothetical protein Kfla_5596 [Kribbella flavida DSM 17836]